MKYLRIVVLAGWWAVAGYGGEAGAVTTACSNGDAHACYRLGMIYARGENGIARDMESARTFVSIACQGGVRKACDALRSLRQSPPARQSGSTGSTNAPIREQMIQYYNDRFGFTLRYPATFFVHRQLSDNGDGITLRNRDNTVALRAYGSWYGSDIRSNFRDELGWAREAGERVTYKVLRRNWYVLSGYENGESRIFYQKTYFDNGKSLSYRLLYPSAERARYSDLIELIDRNFTFGGSKRAGDSPPVNRELAGRSSTPKTKRYQATDLKSEYSKPFKIRKLSYGKLKRFKEQCLQADAEACYKVGIAYWYGDGVTENDNLAKNFFDLACRGGVPRACERMAEIYIGMKRLIKKPNPEKARKFAKIACDGKIGLGCDLIGYFYDNGRGVDKNAVLSKKYDRMSLGYYQADCKLGSTIENYDYGEYQDVGIDCSQLAWDYAHDKNIQQDKAKALQYLIQACRLQNAESCNTLGVSFEYGWFSDIDLHQAVKYHAYACALNYDKSCTTLGEWYWFGEKGVIQKDLNLANIYYRKSCNLGNKESCKTIDKLN